MAMTSLNIDYEATKRAGNNVQSKADEFKGLLSNIQNLNDSLKQCWKGADADSYTNKISEQAKVMSKLQVTIQEIGEYLVSVGNAYEKAMNENKVK